MGEAARPGAAGDQAAGACGGDPTTGTTVRIALPDPRLQSFVTFYYLVSTTAPLEDFLYPEWGNVRFSLSGEWRAELGDAYPDRPLVTPLFGPTDRAARVWCGTGEMAGFGLTPLGWERFFKLPADKLANRLTDVGHRLGRPAEEIRAELIAGRAEPDAWIARFDALLLARLAATRPNSAMATTIDQVLRERPGDVTDFAARVGVSERTLLRACLRVFGFGTKRLLRRQRFLDILGRMRVNERAEFVLMIAAEYFDQSHFNREFREFMGLTPSEFLSAPRPLMAEAARVQQAAGITLSFQLPPAPEEGVGGRE